jgi:hypothetical protein
MKHGDLPKPKAKHEDTVWSLAYCPPYPWLSYYQLVSPGVFMCSLNRWHDPGQPTLLLEIDSLHLSS